MIMFDKDKRFFFVCRVLGKFHSGRYSPMNALQFGQWCRIFCKSDIQNGIRQQPSQQPKNSRIIHTIQAKTPVDSSTRVIIGDRQCGQVHWTGILPKVGIGATCIPYAVGSGGFGLVYFISLCCSCEGGGGGAVYIAARDPAGGGTDLSITSARKQKKLHW